jgi:hypothetical protein
MTIQAYLDNIKEKTGNSPDDFRKLAAQKGLTEYRPIMVWLKTEFGLGHGHANLIAQILVNEEKLKASPNDKFASHFVGPKAKWREVVDDLAARVTGFGTDVSLSPNRSYINILRGSGKFSILQVSSADRIDIGIKLKGVSPAGRLEESGSWNNMVTHRVRITDPVQIDSGLLSWLKQAYDAAGK